ncbi:ABC transporter permease [Candidatus Woesearchaeota archaeon]|nr:ABC transporter permease [Candidatus Woesearchaeota archaeon]
MKGLQMLFKDAKLLLRDTKTVVLVVVTPLLITLILALLFSNLSTEAAVGNVKVGWCDLDQQGFSVEGAKLKLMDLGKNCNATAEQMVKEGSVAAAIIIPKGFQQQISEGHGSSLQLYLDTTQVQTAHGISTEVRALVEEMNQRIGVTFISEAWKKLKALNDQLAKVTDELEQAHQTTLTVRNQTQQLKDYLASVNLTQAEEDLATANRTLHEIQANLSIVQQKIQNYQLMVSSLLQSAVPLLNMSYNQSCQNQSIGCAALLEGITVIENASATLNNASLSTEVQTIAALNTTALLLPLNAIGDLSTAKAEVQENLTTLLATIDAYAANIDAIIVEIQGTHQLLEQYTARDPQYIVRAVSVDEKESLEQVSYLWIMTPALICVVLLFIGLFISSNLIVQERRAGTMLRNALAPVSLAYLIFMKVVFLFVLAIIQATLIVVVLMLFGMTIALNIYFLSAIAAICLLFMVLGLCIGCVVKSENSALLTSLVLALPMMFLSGIFYPFEMMPASFAWIGGKLPLTMALQALQKGMLYHGEDWQGIIVMLGVSVMLYIISVYLVWRKPVE